MADQLIFVNLPVSDLERSRAFHAALGFGFDDRFSDSNALCVVVSPTIYLMLLLRPFFEGFAPNPASDPSATTAVLIALSRDSRAAVDAFAEAAVGAGGSDTGKVQDLGFMYSRSVADPDGHVFEPMWMDPGAAAPTLGEEIDAAVDA